MLNTEIEIKNAGGALVVRVGDRVKHHSGATGVVVAIENRFKYVQEYPGGEKPIYEDCVIVREDKRPRQRKENIPVRWDGIVEVVGRV